MIGYVSDQKTSVEQVPLKVNEILCRIVLLNGLSNYQGVCGSKRAAPMRQEASSMKRHYTILKLIINLIIFGFALAFEGASPERTAMVEEGISLGRKKGNIAAAILSVAALSKYVYVLGFGVSASILS